MLSSERRYFRPPRPLERLYNFIATERLINLFASSLSVARQEVRTLLKFVGRDLLRLEALTLGELEAVPDVSRSTAQKVFYAVQVERLQRHLEDCGALPEPDVLTPLRELLKPIYEAHFEARQMSASFSPRYRAHYMSCIL